MVLREGGNIVAKIKAGREKETIAQIQKLYNNYNPGLSFDYKFLDDTYQNFYQAEQRIATLSSYFSGIAIIISCLGLFGLAAFTAERRLKEIGIRKVMGSSVFSIVYLLSSDFTKIVFTAIVIALPVSYYGVKYWLNSFVYRIDLGLSYFISAGILALLIAWLTVGMQALKAARVNPAQCLKDE
jgi:ABC-type antimicrobial peptide transport system permease subunit